MSWHHSNTWTCRNMNILSMQQQPKWISSNGHAMYQVHLKELIFPNCNRHQALPPDLKMKSPLQLFLPPHPLSLVLSRYPVLEKNISHHTLYAYYNISCTKRTCLLYIWRTFDEYGWITLYYNIPIT